jgi:hypothetical protein
MRLWRGLSVNDDADDLDRVIGDHVLRERRLFDRLLDPREREVLRFRLEAVPVEPFLVRPRVDPPVRPPALLPLEAGRDVERRLEAFESPRARALAVSRDTSLLKLLCPPRAVLSWTTSASPFSSKALNQSCQEISWSLSAPL